MTSPPLPTARAATPHAQVRREAQTRWPSAPRRSYFPRWRAYRRDLCAGSCRLSHLATRASTLDGDSAPPPPPSTPSLSASLPPTSLLPLITPMTTFPSDDFVTGQGAGWRAGYLAGILAERRRAEGGGGGSNPGSPLLGSLMDEWSGLFEAEVLPRMDPTSRAILAQVNRAGRDAVRLPAGLACAGRTVGVPLKLVDFVGSVERLAWAKANGCPWVAHTCRLVAVGGDLEALLWARAHGCPWHAGAWRLAALGGHLDVVRWLMATWADVNYTSPHDGTTAVYVAAYNGYLDVVGLLIDAGANVNITNNTGVTPLYVAAQQGRLDVVRRLISAGADVEIAPTETGATPLLVAADLGHLDVVVLLIVAGADVNTACTDTGTTPLLEATQNGHADVVERLLSAPGVDVNQALWNGATPLSIALLLGHAEVVEALRAAGATEPHG